MKPVAPVPLAGEQETVFGANQPEYAPLPAVVAPGHEVAVTSEWELDADERERLIAGGRVVLTLLTYGHALQPIILTVGPR